MKRFFFALSLILSSTLAINAQGIEFFQGTWQEALDKATAEEKLIFVDAYTSWCGPCKRMAAQVFPLPEVGAVYNERFINYKFNMEKGEGPKFASKYRIRSYPTLLWINGKGEVVHKEVGGKKPNDLIRIGKMAANKIDNIQDLTAEYEAGKRDPAFMAKYIGALKRSNEPYLKVANEYLSTQEDLNTPENLLFIYNATGEADSRIFDLLVKNRSAIESIKSSEDVEKLIGDACNSTVKKAISFESEDLLIEAKAKMKDHCPEKAVAFGYLADMNFYGASKNSGKFIKAAKGYMKKEAKNNAAKIGLAVDQLLQYFDDQPAVIKKGEAWAKKAAENGGKYKEYVSYAKLLQIIGKRDLAKTIATQAIELAKNEKTNPAAAQSILMSL